MPTPPVSEPPRLADLLERHRADLVRFLEREGAGLRRFESAEDLAQAVHLQALEVQQHFAYQGEEAFRGWLYAIARQQIARRNEHWNALKRRAGAMVRITAAGSSSPGADPRARATGPATAAERKEICNRALAAIATLLPRDQEIMRLVAEGAGAGDIARALGLAAEAAGKARRRAIERFRKAYEILGRAGRRRGAQ